MVEGLLAGVSDAYPYAPIQYHDSWLAVDPVIGCRATCSYCLLRLANWTGVRPEVVVPIPEIVDRLVRHRYFVPHTTRLCFGTRTDVLIPEVTPHLLDFLAELERRELRNPVALISKLEISEESAAELARLQHVRVVYLASWSALPRGVERGVRADAAVRSMERLAGHGVPVIHYFRPMLPANTDEATLRRVLGLASRVADATVHVGIKLNPHLRTRYADDPVLSPAAARSPSEGAWAPDGAVDRLRRIAREVCPDHPLYPHTSCAVSYVLGEPDYTATYHRPSVCQPSHCPDRQRAACALGQRVPTADEVRARLGGIGVDRPVRIDDGVIHVEGELGQEDYCYLLHSFNRPIVADVAFFRVFRGGIFAPVEAGPSAGD